MKKLILIGFVPLLFSCSNQPECDDSDVKDIVKEIYIDDYRGLLEKKYINNNYNRNDIYQFAKENNKDYDELNEEILASLKKESSLFSDSIISVSKIEVNGIRLLDKNEKIKKCECAAELILDDENYDIEYSAQHTEDGKIYVELSYQ